MTQKEQKATRKNDKKSIVNIQESGYNERQVKVVEERPYKDFKELDLTNNFLFLKVMQDPDIALGDETTKIFLNPHSEMDDVSQELANFLKFLTDGKPVDEFTERLMKAVETAKNNKILELEYMSYYANMHDKYNEGLKAGHDEGLKTGLIAMVEALKPILKDFDKVYDAIAETKAYTDITREEVMECYQRCP